MADPDAPVVLVPGYWLGAWAWDDVAARLRAAGRQVTALTLPGLEPGASTADRAAVRLDDQVRAVVAAVRAAPGAVLVGHSGAGPVIQLAADAVPDLVSHLVWVDSGPAAGGPREGPGPEVEVLPLPGWEEVEADGSSLEGLDAARLATFAERAVLQPAAVGRDEVRATGAWAGVPATVVCTSVTAAQVQEWAAAGVPFVAGLTQVEHLRYVDLPTGHWPMWSRPDDLADLLAAV